MHNLCERIVHASTNVQRAEPLRTVSLPNWHWTSYGEHSSRRRAASKYHGRVFARTYELNCIRSGSLCLKRENALIRNLLRIARLSTVEISPHGEARTRTVSMSYSEELQSKCHEYFETKGLETTVLSNAHSDPGQRAPPSTLRFIRLRNPRNGREV